MPVATVQRECRTCGQPFVVEKKRTWDPRRGRYCSRSCASVYSGHRSKELHPGFGLDNPNFRHGDSGYAYRYSGPYKRANPERASAHKKVYYALKHGKLTKPQACQACGHVKRLDAHHEDYEEPLVVRWLCRLCHQAEHRSTVGVS